MFFCLFPTAMQLGFNLWAWTWCNISRPRKSGTLGGGTGGTCGTRCPGTFAFLEPKEFLEPVEPVKRMGFHRFQAFLGFKHAMVPQVPDRFFGFNTPLVPQVPDRFLGFNHATGSTASRQVPWVQTRNGSTGSTQVLCVQFATGSTGSRQVPWVQPRYGFNHAMGSTGSMQVPWVQPRHWFQTGSLG